MTYVTAGATVFSAFMGSRSSKKAAAQSRAAAERLAQSGDTAAKLGRDQFDWYKAEYAKTQPQRDAAAATAEKVGASQLAGMEFATQQARDMDTRNKTVFQPLEDRLVSDASQYDTAGRRIQASNEAAADVEGAFGRAQDGLARDLARTGAAPGGGRSMSLMQDAALKKATAVAGATTGAVKNVEQQGYARTMDAVGLGKGIVGSQATQQGIAQAGGAQASAAAAAGINASQSGAPLMERGFNGAQDGILNQSKLYGQAGKFADTAYTQKNDSLKALGVGVGELAGMAGKIFSDEGIKSGTGKKASTKSALAEVVDTPVEDGWVYDEAKGAPAGSGGVEHTGPMAQQVHRTMGEKVAPGGKAIDLVSMNGKLMASMQELVKRVKKLEGASA